MSAVAPNATKAETDERVKPVLAVDARTRGFTRLVKQSAVVRAQRAATPGSHRAHRKPAVTRSRLAHMGRLAVRTARAWALGGALASATVALAACAPVIPVEAAPYAADPDCARVMLAAPESLGGLALLATTSQATAAYGEEYPIIVRCGVEPSGPTADPCLVVTSGTTSLGWLVTETDDAWQAVSFGHSPAVEVTAPKVRVDQAFGDILSEVAPSAALAPSNGLECR